MNSFTTKKIIISCAVAVVCCLHGNAQISFNNNPLQAISIEPATSTGLDAIYVINTTAGVTMSYTSTNGTASWYRFSSLGGAYAEPVSTISVVGNVSTIALGDSDMGYIVEDGDRRHYYWVVNYNNHRLSLDNLEISDESGCDRTFLNVIGSGGRIAYYTINGRPLELSRELSLSYKTLEYDRDAAVYREKVEIVSVNNIGETISCQAPLCNTDFTLSGDRFLSTWGQEQSVTSSFYTTPAVAAETSAEQKTTEYDNEQKSEVSGLGGSAPCEITFTAVVSDAVVFREWQFSKTAEFEDVYDRYNSDVLDHTFDENGTTYVRFVCANAAGDCTYESEVYTIDIGESRLECPNAFSPANQDGVNDLWKVSYKSIVSFECHIFNRWGKKLATLTHPSQGWDGRVGNKFVPSGVYFYVIKARGADGKNYDLSGDINIINSRNNPTPGTSSDE